MEKLAGRTTRDIKVKGQMVPAGTPVTYFRSNGDLAPWVLQVPGVGSRYITVRPAR